MKKIIYIGNFSFPLGNASGKRVYGIGKALRELGYEVLFIGMDNKIKDASDIKNTELEYDNFKYYNISYPKNIIEWLYFFRIYKEVIKFIEKENLLDDLYGVIFYGSLRVSLINYFLMKWLKRKKIKIITDCVDWLSVKTNNLFFDIVKYIDTSYQKIYINNKCDAVIVISSYLSQYYKKRNKKVILIPPLSSIIEKRIESKNKDKIKILYAGLPFRKGIEIKNSVSLKDRIDLIINLMCEIKKLKINFEFNIYGFTKDEYLKVLPSQLSKIKFLDKNLKFYGHKSNEVITAELKRSDFTILLRDIKKETMAGFPTKISESISYGVPVLVNNTSDLKMYIKKFENGYLFEDDNRILEELVNVLKNKEKFKNEIQDTFYYKNNRHILELKKIF